MTKLKNPLLSLKASGTIGKMITFVRRRKVDLVEKKPVPVDRKSSAQLIWRHMYSKCADLWHELSGAEKQEWESQARSRHMTGYAWFLSQCLRPNPGIYLPLQGGTMSGDIDMAKHRLLKLPAPSDSQEPVRFGGHIGCRVYHSASFNIPNSTMTTHPFNSQEYDTDAIHDTVTNNSRLTCKAAGKYLIFANIRWAINTTGDRRIVFRVNGTPIIHYVCHDATATYRLHPIAVTLYDLAVGDYVECLIYQTSGGPLNSEHQYNYLPNFGMSRIVS